MDDPRALYIAGRDARARDVAREEARATAVGTARLVVAVAIVGLLIGMVWWHLPSAGWLGVIALAGGFIGLVMVHAAIHARKDRAGAALRFHERGLARLDDRWGDFPSTGARFLADDHPYAEDLDVFGRASLFQLLDVTETRFGEERLASWLSGSALSGKSAPETLASLTARQAAVKELAPRLAFRAHLSAAGNVAAADKPDPSPFLAWAEGALAMPSRPVVAALARALPVVTIGLFAFAPSIGVPRLSWIAPLVAQLVLIGATRAHVAPIAEAASSREGALARFGEMLALLESETFDAPALRDVKAKLAASGASATREMARLRRILGFLDARQNEVWRLFIGPVLLWDLNCVLFLESWRARAGRSVRAWLDAIGEVEALSSLAGFAFERPDHAWPELGEEARFDATALGHPLIGAKKRVPNDVALHRRGEALIITGSNMSGKSTLLRAIGVNAVLALAGAPVCATRLGFGPLHVVASMRVRDSLEEGVSRFYAEVRKLKRVIDRARSGAPTLFLLDEILHGTNSRERLIGARAIVRELIARGAMGGVSTHDLAIGDLETELPGKVTNVHFEEQVSGDTMTFDYRLRPGVVHSSNALRIMKMVGIDVVDPG
jgi:hypothetical protein